MASGASSRYSRWCADLRRGSASSSLGVASYVALKAELTRAPDGSYPTEMYDEDATPMTQEASSTRRKVSAPPLEVNNPLSLSDKNPWHTYFASLSTLDQITIDVLRAFPEDERMRTKLAQGQLTRVLFVWSLRKENEHIGYRQGMHEIAAICWLVRSESDSGSSVEIEADTFTLFALIMEQAKKWYEWRNQTKYPISWRCEAVQELLMKTDSQLAVHLTRIGMEIQLFAIRWIRLIFTRELPFDKALLLWGSLFSADPSLELVDAVCVAMLVRIRRQLLDSDYSSAFQVLLNYPTYALMDSPSDLIRQSQSIRRSPDEMTLMSLVQQNEETLDIPAITKDDTEVAANLSHSSSAIFPPSVPPSLAHLTRGINAQTLSAGFGRALLNVQKTVNAAYLAHNQMGDDDGFPPAMNSVHRSALAAREASELDRLRQTNRIMGGTLIRVIDVLEKHWTENVVGKQKEDDGEKASTSSKAEMDYLHCLMTLKHGRDVLLGAAHDFDPTIMDGPKLEDRPDTKAKEFGRRFQRSDDAILGAIATVRTPSMEKKASTDMLRSPSTENETSSPMRKTQSAILPGPRMQTPISSPQIRSSPPAREPVYDPLGVLQ